MITNKNSSKEIINNFLTKSAQVEDSAIIMDHDSFEDETEECKY